MMPRSNSRSSAPIINNEYFSGIDQEAPAVDTREDNDCHESAYHNMDRHASHHPAGLTPTTMPSIDEQEVLSNDNMQQPSSTNSLWSDLLTAESLAALKRQVSSPRRHNRNSSIRDFFQSTFLLPKRQTPTPPVKKQSKWEIVRRHVRAGDFLVRARSNDDDDKHHHEEEKAPRRHRRLLKAYQQIHQRIHFSAAQCMWLIVCYVALSVVLFSFLFQKWTIIDR